MYIGINDQNLKSVECGPSVLAYHHVKSSCRSTNHTTQCNSTQFTLVRANPHPKTSSLWSKRSALFTARCPFYIFCMPSKVNHELVFIQLDSNLNHILGSAPRVILRTRSQKELWPRLLWLSWRQGLLVATDSWIVGRQCYLFGPKTLKSTNGLFRTARGPFPHHLWSCLVFRKYILGSRLHKGL